MNFVKAVSRGKTITQIVCVNVAMIVGSKSKIVNVLIANTVKCRVPTGDAAVAFVVFADSRTTPSVFALLIT